MCARPLLLLASLCLLLPCCHSASSALREAYLRDWQVLPPDSPPNIKTEAEIEAIARFVSPVLQNGFGNILYQMAAAYSVSLDLGIPCVFGWWDQHKHGQVPRFTPYGGRSPPAPNITLKHIFPNMNYIEFDPATRNVTESTDCFCVAMGTQGFTPLPRSMYNNSRIWMHGEFRNPKGLDFVMSIEMNRSVIASLK